MNQHKIYYSTLNNTLAVGTRVRGATSNALGIVMEHNTTDKYVIDVTATQFTCISERIFIKKRERQLLYWISTH